MSDIELPFRYTPRNYQMSAWEHFIPPVEGLRGACVWHRRAGKDLFGINLLACKAFQRIGAYWHIFPTYRQGKKIAWLGATRDGRRFMSYFPPELIRSTHETDMRVQFVNGSTYEIVGSDNIDSLVGANPIGCIFSEYSLQDPQAWNFIRPILAENGGWALFIYTARGKNHGYTLFEMAKKNKKWFCERLTAGSGDEDTKRPDGTPVITDEIIQDERDAGMPEEMIQQEFKCSFEAPVVGSYYGKQMLWLEREKRICSVPWEPRLQVHTSWDLGVSDTTVIWFIQEYGSEIRVIDFYENSGEGLSHYVRVMRGQTEGKEYMSEWTYGRHYGPHDIKVREMGSGKSRKMIAQELGLKFTVVKKIEDIADGIEAVRVMLPSCWFDQEKCERGIEALRNYRKEWDETNKVYRDHPKHDWASNPADALRTYAWGRRLSPGERMNRNLPRQTVDDYDYLSGRRSVTTEGQRRIFRNLDQFVASNDFIP